MKSQCRKMNRKGQKDTPTWRGFIKQFKVLHSNLTIITRRVSMDICILVEKCHKCCRSDVTVLWGMNFLINPKCNIALDKYIEGLKSHGDSRCQLQFSWTLYDWKGILPAIRFPFFNTRLPCASERWGQHTNNVAKLTTMLRWWICMTCNQYGNVVHTMPASFICSFVCMIHSMICPSFGLPRMHFNELGTFIPSLISKAIPFTIINI